MESRQEITHFDESVPLKIFLHKLKNIAKHCHQNPELIFVLAGQLTITIEDTQYILGEDDLVMINTNQIHELESTGCVLVVLQLNSTYFDQKLIKDKYPTFNCNSSLFQDKSDFQNLKVLIAKLVKINTDNGAYVQLKNNALFYDILYELISRFKSDEVTRETHSQRQMDRISRIVTYINEHYTEDITLSKIATVEYLSISYLSRYFEKNMGQTFKSFLSSIRVAHAHKDLMATGLSIDEIAEKNGFPNTRAFVSAFKTKYEDLPSAYRKKNCLPLAKANTLKNKPIEYTELDQSSYLSILSDYLKSDTLSIKPISLDLEVITANPIDIRRNQKTLTHEFKTMISIGKARDILHKEVQDMLIEVQRDIGFKFIQFHGFFNDDIRNYFQNSIEQIDFNFDYTDKIFDFVLSIRMKPIIKLGFEYKQSLLISELLRSPNVASPILKKWSHLLKSFFQHLINRYGIDEVQTWIFTLQEELDRVKLHVDTIQEQRYWQLYLSTYRIVKQISPKISFGPSPLMPYMLLESELYEHFYNFCKKNNCLPDFLSFKYFPVDAVAAESPDGSVHFHLSEDPDGLKHFIQKIKGRSKGLFSETIPFMLTDWNASTSNSDLLNDTCYKSCYIVKNILENYDELKSFGYWILSDYNDELTPGNELFHGGLGLFTKNSIKKPAYYAFWLLNKLGNTLLARGDGYFVTKQGHTIQILLYNYCHYSNLYAHGEMFDMTFYDRYTPFVHPKTKEFNFVLTHLEKGSYVLTEYAVNREHGSSFDAWVEMFSMPVRTAEELSFLRARSVPGLKKQTIEVTKNEVQLTFEVIPHEVKMVTVQSLRF